MKSEDYSIGVPLEVIKLTCENPRCNMEFVLLAFLGDKYALQEFCDFCPYCGATQIRNIEKVKVDEKGNDQD